jgi:hypothetical protein
LKAAVFDCALSGRAGLREATHFGETHPQGSLFGDTGFTVALAGVAVREP